MTRTRMHILYRSALLAVVGVGLSSCGSSRDSNQTPTTPPAQKALQEDQFGLAFGTDFRAAMNAEPFAVGDGDIVPVSLTTEPVSITD